MDAKDIEQLSTYEPEAPKRAYRKKTVYQKTAMNLSFDHDQLLELTKVLFQSGLTYHQYFGYLVQQTISRDNRLLDLLVEAQKYKKQRVLEGKEESVDAETLYRLIEEQLSDGGNAGSG